MATEANKLKVGVFLIAGFLLFNAALVWIGTSRVLEKTEQFVTFFDESVQGLEPGAAVTYRGVAIGRVGAIGVAPDGRLVQVSLDVAEGFRARPGMRASLTSSGLTGISVVELGFARGGGAAPELTFPAPSNYIPSQPSFMAGLAATVSGLAEGLRGTDVPGLVADYRAAALAARDRLEAPEIDAALARVAGAAGALDALSRRLSALAEDPRLPETLERLRVAAGHIEGASRLVEQMAGDPRLPQTLEHARAAAASVQETSAAATRAMARWDRLAADLQRSTPEVIVRLDRAADRVEGLAASLETDPSRLLGKPPSEDFR